MVQMILEVDNSQCDADIKSITLSIDNNVSMKSQGTMTNSSFRVVDKVTSGLLKNSSRLVIF